MPRATLVYLVILGFTIAVFVLEPYAVSFKTLVGEL